MEREAVYLRASWWLLTLFLIWSLRRFTPPEGASPVWFSLFRVQELSNALGDCVLLYSLKW